MSLERLFDESRDCARLVLCHLTRRQALLASQTCKQARRLFLELAELEPNPFREAIIVACSQPGRLLEVDVPQGPASSFDGSGVMMWNSAPPSWKLQEGSSGRKKRRRRASLGFCSASKPRKHEPWMTGLAVGPPAWERVRRGAAAAAATASEAPAWGAEGTATLAPRTTGPASHSPVSASPALNRLAQVSPPDLSPAGPVPGSAAAAPPPADPGPGAESLRLRPTGPTLYACCYSVPGIVAFDGTTLLPLGVLTAFPRGSQLGAPEGLCACSCPSGDFLFAVGLADCTLACIALVPTQQAMGTSADSDPAAAAAAAAAAVATRQQRLTPEVKAYGGYLSYGRGQVVQMVSVLPGWMAWGVAAAPDGSGLYCAIDLPYDMDGLYSTSPPPTTAGSVLRVPMQWLDQQTQLGSAAADPWDAGAAPDMEMEVGAAPVLPPPAGAAAAAAAAVAAAAEGVLAPLEGGIGATTAPPDTPAPTLTPHHFVLGEPLLRRPSGLRFSPDGRSLWVTSFDVGLVQLAAPGRDDAAAGTVLRVVQLPPLVIPGGKTLPGRVGRARPGSGADGGGGGNGGGGGSDGVGAGDAVAAAAVPRRRRGRPGCRGSILERMLAWDVCWVRCGPGLDLGGGAGAGGRAGGGNDCGACGSGTGGCAGGGRGLRREGGGSSGKGCEEATTGTGKDSAGGPRSGDLRASESPASVWSAPLSPPCPIASARTSGVAGYLNPGRGAATASQSDRATMSAPWAPTGGGLVMMDTRSLSPESSPPHVLLCCTLHEDTSRRQTESSMAECRVGVVREIGTGKEEEEEEEEETDRRDGRAGSSAGSGVGSGEVVVAARWRSTREHCHPSMACAC